MASRAPSRPGEPGVVRERRASGEVPLYVHPDWTARFPWLAQGTTGRGDEPGRPFDLGLFGAAAAGVVLARWRALRERAGCAAAVHARQVHGAAVDWHDAAPSGVVVGEERDGHATRSPGVMLAVSVADCVPIFVVDPDARAVALLHAGWRGTAAGVLEAGVRTLVDRGGAEPERLRVHFGPAICGRCYEVGPEVHAALGLASSGEPAPVDLRATLAVRARTLGVPDAHITTSAHCTRCGGDDAEGESPFFSYRAGDTGRQMAVLGIRPRPVAGRPGDGPAADGEPERVGA